MQSSIYHGRRRKKWISKAISRSSSSTKILAHTPALARKRKRDRECWEEGERQHGARMKRRMCCAELCSRWLKVWIFSLLFTFINSSLFLSFFLAHTHDFFSSSSSFSSFNSCWHCRWIFAVAAFRRLVLAAVVVIVVVVVVCRNYFIYGMKFFSTFFLLFCPLKEHGQYYLFTRSTHFDWKQKYEKINRKIEGKKYTHAQRAQWMHACTPELLFSQKKKN